MDNLVFGLSCKPAHQPEWEAVSGSSPAASIKNPSNRTATDNRQPVILRHSGPTERECAALEPDSCTGMWLGFGR
ncbi:Hypothetical predicted protein [Olea europaea subsp. europaea]|uniref:Uncharacterized protein n=1 Tax=Olea europaea subsp. europaea TaxID=158383 RepID=A0A8S0STQ2_OLEEU|nr:Hypothetical predicted protein [Olea europaea subsp. europaea]